MGSLRKRSPIFHGEAHVKIGDDGFVIYDHKRYSLILY